MSTTRRSENLWEYTWKTRMPLDMDPWVQAFRVVGWYYPENDDKVSSLHYEELVEDAMGEPCWRPTQDDAVPELAMARLLQLAGKLPVDADLSEL